MICAHVTESWRSFSTRSFQVCLDYIEPSLGSGMMLSSFSVLANVCLIWFTLLSLCSASTYEEHLVLKPLPQQSLLGSFNFRSSISESSFRAQNFQTFPRSLGQILLHSHTDELHLRFSTGRWDAETWGPRPWDGTKEGGTGVELWAWVEGHTEQMYVISSTQVPPMCLFSSTEQTQDG